MGNVCHIYLYSLFPFNPLYIPNSTTIALERFIEDTNYDSLSVSVYMSRLVINNAQICYAKFKIKSLLPEIVKKY